MEDEIVIAKAMKDEVRVHAIRSTALVEAARTAHALAPTSAAALGRTLSVTALLASDLKNPNEHVQVKINGNGPIGLIQTEADGEGNVRGFCYGKDVYLSRADGHLDVGKGVGIQGTLSVSRDMGLKEPFTGTVPLQSGEIGQDFAYYFMASEQVPSIVSVGVLVNTDCRIKAAGGLIIQLMPNASEKTIETLETLAGQMRPMSEYMSTEISLEELIHNLLEDAQVLEHRKVRWHCDCSREHFHDALATLRAEDLEAMLEEDRGAEVVCTYCNKKYQFTESDLKGLLEKKNCVTDR